MTELLSLTHQHNGIISKFPCITEDWRKSRWKFSFAIKIF